MGGGGVTFQGLLLSLPLNSKVRWVVLRRGITIYGHKKEALKYRRKITLKMSGSNHCMDTSCGVSPLMPLCVFGACPIDGTDARQPRLPCWKRATQQASRPHWARPDANHCTFNYTTMRSGLGQGFVLFIFFLWWGNQSWIMCVWNVSGREIKTLINKLIFPPCVANDSSGLAASRNRSK